MIGAETAAFLESGCVLIVGTVAPDGEPHVARGWGVTVLGGEPTRLRLLIDSYDSVAIANLASGAKVAVTGGCVRTLQSTQLKGHASAIEPVTTDDEERAERYIDEMTSIINEVDGTPRSQIGRLRPSGYVACTVTVDEFYDQSPGPRAGAAIDVSPS
jgi:Pyridoxamine 5'-phosphate oxidase